MQANGLLQIASRYPVDETVKRLEAVLAEKGVRLFALIDHSGEAEKIGMKMRPTKLLIFGNPKGGTPLMVATAWRARRFNQEYCRCWRVNSQSCGIMLRHCPFTIKDSWRALWLKIPTAPAIT
jgi:hypothetical protein